MAARIKKIILVMSKGNHSPLAHGSHRRTRTNVHLAEDFRALAAFQHQEDDGRDKEMLPASY